MVHLTYTVEVPAEGTTVTFTMRVFDKSDPPNEIMGAAFTATSDAPHFVFSPVSGSTVQCFVTPKPPEAPSYNLTFTATAPGFEIEDTILIATSIEKPPEQPVPPGVISVAPDQGEISSGDSSTAPPEGETDEGGRVARTRKK